MNTTDIKLQIMVEIIFDKRNEENKNSSKNIIIFEKNKEKYYFDLYDFIKEEQEKAIDTN